MGMVGVCLWTTCARARARAAGNATTISQAWLVWAFFAEKSGPSFSFFILSAMHLVAQKDMCDGNSRCVIVDHERARARCWEHHYNQPQGGLWSEHFLC